eukprot:305922-Alexandrium_andersonii.AAC.1
MEKSNLKWDTLRTMKMHGAPVILMSLVWMLLSGPGAIGPEDKTLGWAEFFAGDMEVTKGMLKGGVPATAFEIKRDPVLQNIMHHIGYTYAVMVTLRLRPGAGSNTAPVRHALSNITNLTLSTNGQPL